MVTAQSKRLTTPRKVRKDSDLLLREKIKQRKANLNLLVPVYQSIIALDNQKLVGHEILSRFPEHGYVKNSSNCIPIENTVINPDAFYKSVWNLGLGIESKKTFFDRVTKDIGNVQRSKGLQNIGSLWVNITSSGLGCVTVQELVFRFKFNFPTIPIYLEIHESSRIESRQTAIIHSLQKKGIRFAFDDWGSANDHYTRNHVDLKLLNIDVIKLDKKWLGSPDKLQKEVKTLRNKGVKQILAEGIESDRDLELARSLGIDMGQGYLFDKPSRRIVEN